MTWSTSRDNLSPAGWIAAGLDKFLISYVKNCIFVIGLLKVGLRKIWLIDVGNLLFDASALLGKGTKCIVTAHYTYSDRKQQTAHKGKSQEK